MDNRLNNLSNNPFRFYWIIIISIAILIPIILGLAVAIFNIKIIYLLCLLLGVFIAIKLPKLLYSLFWIFMFIVGPSYYVGIQIFNIQINIVDCLILITFIPIVLRTRKILIFRKISFFQLFLYLYLFLIIVFGYIHNRSSFFFTDFRLLFYIFCFLIFIPYYFAILGPNVIIRITLVSIIIGSFLAVIKAILLNLGIGSFLDNPQVQTLYTAQLGATRLTLLGADTLSVISIPILISMLIGYYRKSKFAILLLIGFSSCLILVLLTYTRMDWISASVGIFIIGVSYLLISSLKSGRKYYIIFCLSSIIFLAFFSSYKLPGAGYSLFDMAVHRFSGDASLGGPDNLAYRLREAQSIIKSISTSILSIIIGNGIGGVFEFPTFPLTYDVLTGWAHSGWVWILLKGGIIGCLLSIIGMYKICKSFWSFPRSAKIDNQLSSFSIGLLGGVISLVAMSLTNNRFASIEGIFFIIFLFSFRSILINSGHIHDLQRTFQKIKSD